jgi:hypothetical protein
MCHAPFSVPARQCARTLLLKHHMSRACPTVHGGTGRWDYPPCAVWQANEASRLLWRNAGAKSCCDIEQRRCHSSTLMPEVRAVSLGARFALAVLSRVHDKTGRSGDAPCSLVVGNWARWLPQRNAGAARRVVVDPMPSIEQPLCHANTPKIQGKMATGAEVGSGYHTDQIRSWKLTSQVAGGSTHP